MSVYHVPRLAVPTGPFLSDVVWGADGQPHVAVIVDGEWSATVLGFGLGRGPHMQWRDLPAGRQSHMVRLAAGAMRDGWGRPLRRVRQSNMYEWGPARAAR